MISRKVNTQWPLGCWSRIFIHHGRRGGALRRYNHSIFQENPSSAHSHWPDRFVAESDWRGARPRHVISDTILTIKYKTNGICIDPIGPARTIHLLLRLVPSMVRVFWSTESLRDTKLSNWSVRLQRNTKWKKIKYRMSGICSALSTVQYVCTSLAERIFVCFQIFRREIVAEFGVIQMLENLIVISGSFDLWQIRHLEEENVQRFPELIRRIPQRFSPNGWRRCTHQNVFLYHRTEMVDKCPTDDGTPVVTH